MLVNASKQWIAVVVWLQYTSHQIWSAVLWLPNLVTLPWGCRYDRGSISQFANSCNSLWHLKWFEQLWFSGESFVCLGILKSGHYQGPSTLTGMSSMCTIVRINCNAILRRKQRDTRRMSAGREKGRSTVTCNWFRIVQNCLFGGIRLIVGVCTLWNVI